MCSVIFYWSHISLNKGCKCFLACLTLYFIKTVYKKKYISQLISLQIEIDDSLSNLRKDS